MKFPLSFLQGVANKLRTLPQRFYKFIALGMAVCLATTSLVFIQSPQTVVAQTVVQKVTLTYGPQQISIPIEELETFAETGEASKVIRFISGFVGDDEELFRTALTQKIPAPNPLFLNDAMDFLVGELFLFEIGQVIHTPSRKNVIEALRASIGLSVLDDREISLLEVIEKYPAQELFIDAKQLSKASQYVTFLVSGAEQGIMFMRETLGDLIC
jgi:hypothetical protein